MSRDSIGEEASGRQTAERVGSEGGCASVAIFRAMEKGSLGR